MLILVLLDLCSVPNLPYPLFTTAMTGLDITCSGFEKEWPHVLQYT